MSTDRPTETWSRLLSQTHLVELANRITCKSIMIPTDRLLSVHLNEPAGDIRQKLRSEDFDQAPVRDDTQVVGLLFTDQLAEVPDSLSIADIDFEPTSETNTVHVDTPIGQLFAKFAQRNSFLVRGDKSVESLVHIADLNRQAVRAYLYLWITAVEMGLGELVESEYGRLNDDWIDYLNDYSQVQVLGRFEVSKRKNVELGYVEGTDLSDLVRVVKHDDDLRRRMGDKSKRKWDELTGSLVDLRHAVMHPVRTLVQSNADAQRLADDMEKLEELVEELREALRTSSNG